MPVFATDVFVNCPFDDPYRPMFNAIVFTVIRSGYRARCAFETDNALENRMSKICGIIGECKFSIHDISRTEVSENTRLPRFNMPLELGIFIGSQQFGSKDHRKKSCVVYDTIPFRYQSFISDIGGQDIHYHHGRVEDLIADLSTWLRHLPGGTHAGGGQSILREYRAFQELIPELCRPKRLQVEELVFQDYNSMITEFVRTLTEEQVAAL